MRSMSQVRWPYELAIAAFTSFALLLMSLGSVSAGSAGPSQTVEVPVSSGRSVTIYEATDTIGSYTFQVSELMTTGAGFSTHAHLYENYTVTSDGESLRIACYCLPPYPRTGEETGSNIVAVRLDGVPGYPGGLWASTIVSYVMGTGGIEESRFNALGPESQLGPYGGALCTYLGDYSSEIVLGFSGVPSSEFVASLNIDPDHINLGSKGRWVTAYIEFPEGYDVRDVEIETVLLNGVIPADRDHKPVVGDVDGDGVPDLMIKFSRAAVQDILAVGPDAVITVTGMLHDGTLFSGSDTVSVSDHSAGRTSVSEQTAAERLVRCRNGAGVASEAFVRI